MVTHNPTSHKLALYNIQSLFISSYDMAISSHCKLDIEITQWYTISNNNENEKCKGTEHFLLTYSTISSAARLS